jgi:Flp pilus assembly pilin Flp
MLEYALILGLIAMVVIGLLQLVGKSTKTALCKVSEGLSSTATAGCFTTYISHWDSNTVTEYAPGATGNLAPVRTISGASTNLSEPGQMALDSSANLWVVNGGGSPDSITEYASGASGNILPVRSIGGPVNSQIGNATGICFDASGNIYAVNYGGANGSGHGYVVEFAPQANGDVAPIRNIGAYGGGPNNLINGPQMLAIDKSGVLYVGNYDNGTITEYAPGVSGDPTPLRTISAGISGTEGLAFDSSQNLYVANQNANTITEYAPAGTAVINTITSSGGSLNGPTGLSFDGSGNLWVSNYAGASIVEYARGATGAAIPIATVSGALTQLTYAGGMALG